MVQIKSLLYRYKSIKDAINNDALYFNSVLKSLSVWAITQFLLSSTRLKNKIENNSTWEDAIYQSVWVKINSSWVILVFSL